MSIGNGNSLAAKLRTDSGSDLGSVLVSSLPLADDDERDEDDHGENRRIVIRMMVIMMT